jgi:uroporphyrinogen-III decarboxylase
MKHLPKMAKAFVRAGVDGVVFDDGGFVGPNRSQVYEYYVATAKRFQEMCRELRGLKAQPDAVIQAKLSEMAKRTVEWVAPLLSISFQPILKHLRRILDQRGREAYEKALTELRSY